MCNFFHGWRRKAGFVLLVIALVFMGGWNRSRVKRDFISIKIAATAYRIGSMGGTLKFVRAVPAAETQFISWRATPLEPGDMEYWKGYEMEWRWDCAGFHFGTGSTGSRIRTAMYAMPYWLPIWSLTLLSACLILWPGKQPERRPKPPVD